MKGFGGLIGGTAMTDFVFVREAARTSCSIDNVDERDALFAYMRRDFQEGHSFGLKNLGSLKGYILLSSIDDQVKDGVFIFIDRWTHQRKWLLYIFTYFSRWRFPNSGSFFQK